MRLMKRASTRRGLVTHGISRDEAKAKVVASNNIVGRSSALCACVSKHPTKCSLPDTTSEFSSKDAEEDQALETERGEKELGGARVGARPAGRTLEQGLEGGERTEGEVFL